jgi:hypothetical protein
MQSHRWHGRGSQKGADWAGTPGILGGHQRGSTARTKNITSGYDPTQVKEVSGNIGPLFPATAKVWRHVEKCE